MPDSGVDQLLGTPPCVSPAEHASELTSESSFRHRVVDEDTSIERLPWGDSSKPIR